VTPLQLAVAYAALANGGTVLRPHVVPVLGPVPGRPLDAAGADLNEYIHEIDTALRAGPLGPSIAGLVSRGHPRDPAIADDLWFAGWFPADRPEVAVVIHAKGADKPVVQSIAADVIHAVSEGGHW
jgi:cell division protein FtsI/penicillin-binding protein 2